MANTITQYELIHFANEGLITLHDKLGISATVHRRFAEETGFRGKTVRIAQPASPTINNFGTGAQDATTSGVDIVLDQHKEAHWKFTDSELFFSRQNVLLDSHIRPAMKELAGAIDLSLAERYVDIPWDFSWDADAADIRRNVTQPRKILAASGAPVDDEGNMFFVMDENADASFRESTIFDFDKVGPAAGAAQLSSRTRRVYQGIEFMYSGKIQEHTSGTVLSAGNDAVGALTADAAIGATSIAVDGLNGSETILAGDSFVLAGNRQRYVVTATTTLSTGAGTITFAPGLAQAHLNNDVITFVDGAVAGNNQDNFYANMVYHRHAFGLAMARLEGDTASEQARRQGLGRC